MRTEMNELTKDIEPSSTVQTSIWVFQQNEDGRRVIPFIVCRMRKYTRHARYL